MNNETELICNQFIGGQSNHQNHQNQVDGQWEFWYRIRSNWNASNVNEYGVWIYFCWFGLQFLVLLWCWYLMCGCFRCIKDAYHRANDVSSLISQCCTGGGVSTHHSHNPNQIEHKINRRLSSRLRVVSTHYCVRATYIHMHMNSAHNIQSRTPTQ